MRDKIRDLVIDAIVDYNKLSEVVDAITALKSESKKQSDIPDIDFRRDIAEELSRDELIERLCDMHKHYVEMRKEWFVVCQLGEKPYHQPQSEPMGETAEDVLCPSCESESITIIHVPIFHCNDCSVEWPCTEEYKSTDLRREQYPDTYADGYVFCGKCGKMK